MRRLDIDLETFSAAPLENTGVYRYVEDPTFEILLFAYSVDGAPVQVVDLTTGATPPAAILAALTDPEYIKRAHNAAFELACLSRYLGCELDPAQWRCSMLHAQYRGYPASLEALGAALGLSDDQRKMAVGRKLIRTFCRPAGDGTRVMPTEAPDEWQLFIEYCRRDVETERTISAALADVPVPDSVQAQWVTDICINRRGVCLDLPMIDGCRDILAAENARLRAEAVTLTGLENPDSVQQMIRWLADQRVNAPDLTKTTVKKLLKTDLPPVARRVLEIRQDLGKTSVKKYDAMRKCVCRDGRARGLLQFYGAGRSGRWAGRILQPQNLPRTYIKEVDLAKEFIATRNAEALRICFGSIHNTLSQLIRTALISPQGKILVDADFSSIEARVIAWLAGEQWRLDFFRGDGDIYCQSASQMFGVPVEKHGVNGELRARGKVAELACGFGGSVGALEAMGAREMGLQPDELMEIVKRWRAANPNIVKLWRSLEHAALDVIRTGRAHTVRHLRVSGYYSRSTQHRYLVLTLPSGRSIFYAEPQIARNRFGNDGLAYVGVNQITGKWGLIETFGGKLAENATQAVARDCLAEAIERLKGRYSIVFHVHDEIVIESGCQCGSDYLLADVVNTMSAPMPWARELPLAADGWVGTYFTKD